MYEIFFALYEKAMCNIHPLCSPRSTPTWPFDVKPPTYEPIGLIPTRELQGNSCRQQASACRGSSVSQPAAKSIKDKSGRSGRIAYAPRNLCIPVWLKFTNRNLEHSEHISHAPCEKASGTYHTRIAPEAFSHSPSFYKRLFAESTPRKLSEKVFADLPIVC